MKIIGISDVSVGYGSPQVGAFMKSLAAHYSDCASVELIEPNQLVRPARPELFPEFDLIRIPTQASHFDHAGRIEYLHRAAARINDAKPDILALFSPYTFPLLLMLRRRPAFVIYYLLESLSHYAATDSEEARFITGLHRRLHHNLNLLIFPEENRAAADMSKAGLSGIPAVVLYNCVNEGYDPGEVHKRSAAFLYTGTIEPGLTMAEYFLDKNVAQYDIHLYGLIEGPKAAQYRAALEKSKGKVRYLGYVTSEELGRIRTKYSYSIVMWAPLDDHLRFAAPNKFFESLASGVPPICAPHPQCCKLIEKYDCGILMDDWSPEAFEAALKRARAAFQTSQYDRLVAGCRNAVLSETNWTRQFEKVRTYLPEKTVQTRPSVASNNSLAEITLPK